MPNFDILLRDLKVALRSLAHTKGLAITVILTLALGIGANAAIFSVVRGVLLRPLVNRDENSLIYIRQSAPGIGVENTTFSVPEIQDMQSRVKTISEFGDFSTIGFSVVGLGEPRQIRGGVVDGSYFDVMGLHPVLGRLLDARDDGNNAAGAVVLTYRFWTTALHSDPSVIGKTIKLDTGDPGGARSATIVGVLEPSVPYPAETEIIANVVTSPHHLSATMVTGRVHRMTELSRPSRPRRLPGTSPRGAEYRLRLDGLPTFRRLPARREFPDQRHPPARTDHLARENRSRWCCSHAPSSSSSSLLLLNTMNSILHGASSAAKANSPSAPRLVLAPRLLRRCCTSSRMLKALAEMALLGVLVARPYGQHTQQIRFRASPPSRRSILAMTPACSWSARLLAVSQASVLPRLRLRLLLLEPRERLAPHQRRQCASPAALLVGDRAAARCALLPA